MDPVKIWKDGAEDTFDTAEKLFAAKKYHHSLFFLHLALEKILKAVYISKKDESPPYIHNLKYLAEKANISISDNEIVQLDEISEFNITARYDEYKYKIYKRATKEYTDKWIKIGKELYRKLFKEI